MVATRRNYTRNEKAAFQRRLDRRYAESVRGASRLGPVGAQVGAAMSGMRQAFQEAADGLRDLARYHRPSAATLKRGPSHTGAWIDEVPAFMNLGAAERAMAINGPWPTAEQLLGMDPASPRPATLEDLLGTPYPAASWADYSSRFAREHGHTPELPEGWMQR